MGIKIFEDLRKEVIEQNLCNLCGACLAVCTANEINAICLEKNIPRYVEDFKDVQKCLECGICYFICGQIPKLDAEIEKLYSANPPIGSYKFLTCAKTTNSEIQKNAQDGGVVTSILKYLLEKNLIDGAVVNKPIQNWESVPQIITSPEELIQSAGTRYSAIPSIQALGTYKILDKEIPRFAFVGTPCQVQCIRKMQEIRARPGIYVQYLIGLFCMENFDYERLMKEKIQKELKIKLKNIKKLNIKKNFFITLNDNKQIEIPLKDLSHLVRNNCHFCKDFTNLYADISVGGIGSPPGYSTVLVRTERGSSLFSKLVVDNVIEELDKEEVNSAKIKADILSQITRLGKIKYDRGTKTKKNLIKP